MAYDLEEQEQLDEFKAWWAKNGRMVSSILLIGVLAYAGWQGSPTAHREAETAKAHRG